MIGVLCKDSEKVVVREFFQLFKTPWEFYREGEKYPVVLSSRIKPLNVDAQLRIHYCSQALLADTRAGLTVETAISAEFPYWDGKNLPVFGTLASFRGAGESIVKNNKTGETLAIQFLEDGQKTIRVGYDLFQEIEYLLREGQSTQQALIPSVEMHISMLRDWILRAGVAVVEIPPVPLGARFLVCLTHDVDFAGIRRHKFDHTMWGFIYRALIGSLLGFFTGRDSFRHLVKNWTAVLSLPLVWLGLLDDFWDHFDRYAEFEGGLKSTFFLIPFKHTVGEKVTGRFIARRATRYDIGDVRVPVERLISLGFEIGVHGIDAWHSVEKGKQELKRVAEVTGQDSIGVRMHWLCFNNNSPEALEQAGFDYDASVGFNETIGYKAGTTQVYQPIDAARLLELPLHIQDTALFYPGRLGLTKDRAWGLCRKLIENALKFGGVLTLSWHERSLAPERLWGDFYKELLEELKDQGAWIGSAGQVVQWFRERRSFVFKEASFAGNSVQLRLTHDGSSCELPMLIRISLPRMGGSTEPGTELSHIDYPYHGESALLFQLE